MALKTAVDTANDPVRAMITTARDSSLCCLDMAAATTPDSPPATGFAICARARRPRSSAIDDSRHANNADPIQSMSGAKNVT